MEKRNMHSDKYKALSVVIPTAQKAAIQEIAARNGLRTSDIIRLMISDYLENIKDREFKLVA